MFSNIALTRRWRENVYFYLARELDKNRIQMVFVETQSSNNLHFQEGFYANLCLIQFNIVSSYLYLFKEYGFLQPLFYLQRNFMLSSF